MNPFKESKYGYIDIRDVTRGASIELSISDVRTLKEQIKELTKKKKEAKENLDRVMEYSAQTMEQLEKNIKMLKEEEIELINKTNMSHLLLKDVTNKVETLGVRKVNLTKIESVQKEIDWRKRMGQKELDEIYEKVQAGRKKLELLHSIEGLQEHKEQLIQDVLEIAGNKDKFAERHIFNKSQPIPYIDKDLVENPGE